MEAKILPDSFNPRFFDAKATHFVQSWSWGDIRKANQTKVVRIGFFLGGTSTEATQGATSMQPIQGGTLHNVAQITFHRIPKIGKTVGHLAKPASLSLPELTELLRIGKEQQAILIRIEPNLTIDEWQANHPSLKKSSQNIFIPHNFLIDLQLSPDQLMQNMHSKTRYNIKVAQKHEVHIEELTTTNTLEAFIALQKETAKRQKFYLHPDDYYRTAFTQLLAHNMVKLLVAKHPNGDILSIWFLVLFKKTITYLYGASSTEHKHMMANNLLAWETIRLGQSLGMETFDFGGTLGKDTDPKNPRFGFHKFKEGFGGTHIDYAGTYDLVIDPLLYPLYTIAEKVRWWILRLAK